MLPPLAYGVCVSTLRRLAAVLSESQSDSSTKPLYLHFADEEGDPYAVALAGRLNAYVAGRDSDFIVLNAEGYQGYIPLDEMVWTLSTSLGGGLSWDTDGSVYSSNLSTAGDSHTPSLSGFGDDEDGFQTVKKKGKKRRQAQAAQTQTAGRGILPPDALNVMNPDSETPIGTEGQLSLSFTVYSPTTLATHLGIPVSVLPLLGALLGNDFTGAPLSDDSAPPPATTAEIRSKGRANLQRLFFERQLTLAQRITRVSSTLSGILATAFDGSGGGKRRGKRAIGSVMELIDAAVTALLIRPLDTFATGEKEAIVERIVEATLQYAVPRVDVEEGMEQGEEEVGGLRWVSGACPLHVQDACPLLTTLSGLVRERDAMMVLREEQGGDPEEADPDDPLELAREECLDAYRRGMLDPHLLDTMQTGTMWPRMFLEDPDKETVLKSVARPIRLWTYAILDAGIGLPRASAPEEANDDDEDGESDEDELVDVVEEDSDSEPIPNAFARLRGALKQLDSSDDEGDGEDAAQDSPSDPPTANGRGQQAPSLKQVTEYVRRGTRLAPEEINVASLEELLGESTLEPPTDPHTKARLPPQIWSYKLRRTLMLHALASNSTTVSSLPDDRLVGVLALRWVVVAHHAPTISGQPRRQGAIPRAMDTSRSEGDLSLFHSAIAR
uniref:Serine/threonine-protein kinase TEL1 (DNA-damage checkpoint kinase TEL1) (Telomere length regulation protein 1)) n=1 Tax=Ganoderma boninense TaxID=34458 RepID=A0A5K1K2R6_9APHY|nr:Serine/threonine-protein kinase TEL1 (EC (ATM homolog) (DNA-damage checkpoint kinase TEL1) (Telomere length regulation protein 1) [Ganoderma boninense]